jgi:hypothetical protein
MYLSLYDLSVIYGKQPLRKTVWVSYLDAKKIIKTQGIKTSREYKAMDKKFRLSLKLPACPHRMYADKGWEGWPVFLGTSKEGEKYKIDNFVSFSEAKNIVKAQGIKASSGYRAMDKKLRFSLKLPTHPEKSYKDKGWEGWAHFLRNNGTKIISFEEARLLVKKLGIKYEREYQKLSKEEREQLGLPCNPRLVYKNKGWVSNPDFYGRKDLRYIVVFTTFEKAKEIVKELGIVTRAEYLKLTPAKRMELGLPSHPDLVYKDKGWICWGDYFGKVR